MDQKTPRRIPSMTGEDRGGRRDTREDFEIRLSGKYNEFNLAFDCDVRTTLQRREPSGVARPTSIDSALFLRPFSARIESLVAIYSPPPSPVFVLRSFSPLVPDSYIAPVHFPHSCLRKLRKNPNSRTR